MIIRKKPEELWKFFTENVFRLKYDQYVAAEDDNGVTVTLSSSADYDPILLVEQDGYTIACYVVDDERELGETAQKIYDLFLSADDSAQEPEKEQEEEPEQSPEEPEPEESVEDTLFEREDALMMAFKDFMGVVIEDEESVYDKKLEPELSELLDKVLQEISDAGFLVYRPMYVTYDDGSEALTDFPYDILQ